MRIRKNATRVFDGKKRSSSSYLICQLNRPPWEDDSFFSQGYWDNDLPLHGTSSCIISPPASHSLICEEPMDLSFECVPERENGGGGDDGGIIGAGDDCPVLLLTMGSTEPTPLDMVLPTPASTVLPKKRGRPRKSTSAASADNIGSTTNCKSNNKGSNNNNNNNNNNKNDDNPYQFYYYSGFGPSWSKRRGETKFNSVPQLDNCNIMDDDDNKDNNNGHEIESFKSVIDAQRELDYIEDEEDEEEWYGGGRARKPIKARSLKSLM